MLQGDQIGGWVDEWTVKVAGSAPENPEALEPTTHTCLVVGALCQLVDHGMDTPDGFGMAQHHNVSC